MSAPTLVSIPWPETGDDLAAWRAAWLKANAHLPPLERYPALVGVLSAMLGVALDRCARLERDAVDAQITHTLEAIR